jgi:hypothetical protein
MNSLLFTSMLVMILSFAQGLSSFQEEPLLWFAGVMHSGEVQAETDDTWLAFCHTPDGYELISTKITVHKNPKKDDIYDTHVTLDTCPFPSLFLIYGVPELTPGSINTVFNGRTYLEPFQSMILELAPGQESTYSLSASGTNKGEETRDYQIRLSCNQKSQLILNRASLSEHIYILWAGDLDRDGRLDLLLDVHDHYNVSEPTLFLSSKAKKDEMVKRFISYRRAGC